MVTQAWAHTQPAHRVAASQSSTTVVTHVTLTNEFFIYVYYANLVPGQCSWCDNLLAHRKREKPPIHVFRYRYVAIVRYTTIPVAGMIIIIIILLSSPTVGLSIATADDHYI